MTLKLEAKLAAAAAIVVIIIIYLYINSRLISWIPSPHCFAALAVLLDFLLQITAFVALIS